MRAVGIMVHGGPEALEVVNLPEVHAGPSQVRVYIRGSSEPHRHNGPERLTGRAAKG